MTGRANRSQDCEIGEIESAWEVGSRIDQETSGFRAGYPVVCLVLTVVAATRSVEDVGQDIA